ncbi:MAG: hypothetical protein IPH11_10030 [Ignavibacteriales bacterium]|nr:hypothetical protein [Ignavibacteriales bacterium]
MLNKWSEEEIKILKRLYSKKGAKPVAKLLGRKPDNVMAKAAKLGIRFSKVRPWEKWEDNYLIRHYADRKNLSISHTLRRSIPSIMNRAKFLNLSAVKSPSWTEEEKNILRELYSDRKNALESISEKLNRSKYAVLLQAQVLGINRPRHDHEWTKEEIDYLKQNYQTKSYGEIASELGHS